MSLRDAHTGLETLLLADAAIAAWLASWSLAALTAIRGNRPVEQVAAGKLPALILEPGDWSAGGLFPGDARRRFESEIAAAVIWLEQSETDAYLQRLELPELLVDAVHTDPTLGGAVAHAYVAGGSYAIAPARPALRVLRFATRVEYDRTF